MAEGKKEKRTGDGAPSDQVPAVNVRSGGSGPVDAGKGKTLDDPTEGPDPKPRVLHVPPNGPAGTTVKKSWEPSSVKDKGAEAGQTKEAAPAEVEQGAQIQRPSPVKRFGDSLRSILSRPDREVHLKKVAKRTDDTNKDLEEGVELMETLELGDKNVKVQIYLNPITNEYIYLPIEPALGPRQKKILEFIRETLSRALNYDKLAMEVLQEKERFLQNELDTILRDYRSVIGEVTTELMEPIRYHVWREYIGYGKIQCLMKDQGVEDISCDGTGIPVFVYHRNFGSIRTTIKFESDEELEGFVVSLAQRAGKTISVAHPILDSTLPEGHRLNATFGREVTTRGSSFTIRKFKEDPLTITDLVKFGTISPQMAAHFWLAVQYGDSMIFAGGTASGKTATMNAISIFIPTSAKIISIEDTREVNLPHQNWIAGLTRGSAEGGRETDIDMYQLLRAALRQRPEYVLVGEVRGKETMTMFQAMATGHITYSTMHADSVKSIVYRLENPPISIPRVLIQALNLVAIHNQLRVKGMRVRRITELVEIVGIEPTSLEIITNRVYRWEGAGDHFIFGGHSNLYEKIMDMEDMTRDEVIHELNRRAEVIEWMLKNDVRKFTDVSTVIVEYYEDSDKVVKLIRENREIDIKKGLKLFDNAPVEKLPSASKEALPPFTAGNKGTQPPIGQAPLKAGGG